MSAVKTATVSLAALILLCSPTSSPLHSDAVRRVDHGALTLRADSSIALITLARPPRLSSAAPFAPWRRRLKSVLEETDQKIGDECDFGPVVLPSRHARSNPVDLNSRRIPTALPLRC